MRTTLQAEETWRLGSLPPLRGEGTGLWRRGPKATKRRNSHAKLSTPPPSQKTRRFSTTGMEVMHNYLSVPRAQDPKTKPGRPRGARQLGGVPRVGAHRGAGLKRLVGGLHRVRNRDVRLDVGAPAGWPEAPGRLWGPSLPRGWRRHPQRRYSLESQAGPSTARRASEADSEGARCESRSRGQDSAGTLKRPPW